MSLINTEVKPFKATAYLNGEFIDVTEADLKGQWSIFFFYPADFTFVCPTELGDLADNYEAFKKLGVEIYSVSTDTHFTHKAWHDSSETMAERGTFVVDPDGKIQIVEINAGNIGRNAEELLRKVKAAQYVRANPNEVCPAKWKEGEETLAPSLDLVGKI